MLPPGWIIPLILCWAATVILSVAGKKPSEAKIASLAESTTLIKAISTAPTLLVWPPQMPIVFKSFAITIAFDFRCFAIL